MLLFTRIVFTVLIPVFVLHYAAAQDAKSITTKQPITSNLNFLKSMRGKYPFAVKLLDKPAMKTRLEKLLGSTEFNYMKKNLVDVATPIKVKNGYFYSWAMQAHSGNDFGATTMADISKNVLYVIIRKDSQEKTYSEDGSAVPKPLLDMAKENS
jgi:hypothetical protein